MAKKATLNPLTDTPQTLVEVTKDFMLAYMKSEKATPEDREWYKKVCHAHVQKVKNRFTGEEVEAVSYKDVRREFCERFFPNLLARVARKNKSYLDLVDEL